MTNSIINQLFSVNENNFEDLCFQVFSYQLEKNEIYSKYVHLLDKSKPSNIKEIPFLPISFFKNSKIISNETFEKIFLSSGTTSSTRSKHYVCDLSLYEKSFVQTFEMFFGSIENKTIIALLPNYIEQGDSSLVYMVDHLIRKSKNQFSGFFLNQNLDEVHQIYTKAIEQNHQVVIFGVSYAILDLADLNLNFSNSIIIETGGMKGRRIEIQKEELHQKLKQGLNCKNIYSEYGMTELLSQAYALKGEIFLTPPWMKILIRDVNDPFSYMENNKTGAINVIDLANIHSCSFIETQDLGLKTNEGFQLKGRMNNADIRGCNLLVN